MDYSKNISGKYAGLMLFFFNVAYLLLLISTLMPYDLNKEVLIISIGIMIFISSILTFVLKVTEVDINIPNTITNCRLVLNIFIFTCILNIELHDSYKILLLVLLSLLLDGVDGYLSRYLNQSTEFGRVFDQEVDNFLIFILTFSLIYNHNFSYILLCVPFYRYIFVILIRQGFISGEDLPESLFRKSICVLTILVLALCNFYIFVESVRGLIYIIIILVSYSFMKDTIYLYRRKNV